MTPGQAIEASYFDGRSAQAQPVRVQALGPELVAAASLAAGTPAATAAPPGPHAGSALKRWPMSQVQWPERTRHGRRVAHLPDGGQLEFPDPVAFDAWRAASGARESWVVRAQQHWRGTLTALALLVAVLVAGYRWGVPLAADALVAAVPPQVDRAVGEAAFENLRSRWLEPSQLPAARQQALREAFTAALAAHLPPGRQRPWRLHFASGGKALGANALALPDGTIVITDEMVALLEGQDDVLLGVFGHEYGHVHERHGMRALARFALVSTATAVALGDFSTVLAGVPALLAQLGYSRDAERQADTEAARLLVASGRRPEVMVALFERLSKRHGAGGTGLPMALASHPLDEERMRFFREFGKR